MPDNLAEAPQLGETRATTTGAAEQDALRGGDTNHHVGPLRVVDPMADHEARVVVDQDERERRGAVDVTVDEVQVP